MLAARLLNNLQSYKFFASLRLQIFAQEFANNRTNNPLCTMDDSPARRSSIPILKQTNKTKSFQSYVNLNLTEDINQQRKSRSPSSMSSMSPPIIEKAPKLPSRPPSQMLQIDNDIIITKLCDENKRLKEHQVQLVSKYEEGEIVARIFSIKIQDNYFRSPSSA